MNKRVISYIIIAVVLIIALIFFVSSSFGKVDPISDNNQLAECLTSKEVKIYVSKYCGHCEDQKEMFGSSFEKLNSIDCADQPLVCQEAGITGVPNWIINGQSYPGVQSLSKLKELTNC